MELEDFEPIDLPSDAEALPSDVDEPEPDAEAPVDVLPAPILAWTVHQNEPEEPEVAQPEPDDERNRMSKYWCWTLNNPDLTGPEMQRMIGDNWRTDYTIFQKEKGDNGTVHFQGYSEFHERKRLTALKRLDRGIHWEIRIGTREQAIAYCSKRDSTEPSYYVISPFVRINQQ